MNYEEYKPKILEDAVRELSRLPGIGRRTALRLALHLLRRPEGESYMLSDALATLRKDVKYCRVCHNISGEDVCEICRSTYRDKDVVCVVESISDVMSLERTGMFTGLYHVLGGLISPLDGIGPEQLTIDALIQRVAQGGIKEIILALGATMEGDTTNFYIYRKLTGLPNPPSITRLAQGVAVGSDLQYTDEITLGRSLQMRTPFADTLKS